MYSKIIVMGRLTIDPELRQTPNNVSVTSFRIAINRPYVTKSGERQTDFFDIVAWRNQAEFICKFFKKGNLILIDGRLEAREYVDKNGLTQRICEIIVENVSFTGESNKSSSKSSPPPISENSKADDFSVNDFKELDDDEDLPF